MSYFFRYGNTYKVSDTRAVDIAEHLPGGNYVVKFNDQTGEFFLEGIEDFNMPPKMYGDNTEKRDRILNTFFDRPAATGVLLVGEKGSGKTLLTKSIAIKLKEMDCPTIIINSPFCGDVFNKFIQSIEQPCAIIMDEFEKVYDDEHQEKVLTLLDGVFPTKKLFLLTTNSTKIDQHLKNRPGRIYYHLEYAGLEESFMLEYCEDNLKYPEHTERLIQIAGCFGSFNFDMLKAVVEEINRYNESPSTVMQLLNARISNDSSVSYDIEVYLDGKKIANNVHPNYLKSSPLAIEYKPNIDIYGTGKVDDMEDNSDEPLEMSEAQKLSIDPFFKNPDFTLSDDKLLKISKGGVMTYRFDHHGKDLLIILTKKSYGKFNFDAF